MIVQPPKDAIDQQQNIVNSKSQGGSYAERYPQLVWLEGFLAWFTVGIVVSVCYNFYQSISGFLNISWLTPEVAAAYPNLQSTVSFENITQFLVAIAGVVLLIHILKLRKLAIRIAIIYFCFLTIYTFIDLALVNTMFAGSSALQDILSRGNADGGRVIAYSIVWLSYFLVSKRVKATLTRDDKNSTSSERVALTGDNVDGDQTPISAAVLPERIGKPLVRLENVALILDKGCRAGKIPTDSVGKSQSYLESVATEILDSKSVGSRAYIVYEVQALIHWATGNSREAHKLAESAAYIKGDNILLTQTANKILRLQADASVDQATQSSARKLNWQYYVLFTAGIFTLLATAFSFVNISAVIIIYLMLTVWFFDLCIKINKSKVVSKVNFNVATIVAVIVISAVVIGLTAGVYASKF